MALLQRHGWNATSFQILERGFSYWFDDVVEACVAYVDTGAAWVAAGAPIAAPVDLVGVARRFLRASSACARRACFFAVEDRLIGAGGLESMPIGEAPSWDPSRWEDTLRDARRLREQLRRARAKGVRARVVPASELVDPSGTLRREVEVLVARWLASRRMAPMGFLTDVQIFDFVEERRCIAAERDGELVGLLVAVPVYARDGWLFEDFLRSPDAPNGTVELLIDTAMGCVAAEGSRYVTLGLAPLAGELRPWLRLVRSFAAALYDFDGLHRFKQRLRPDAWASIHLAWPEGQSGNLALLDSLAAFTMRGRDGHDRASFVRYGVETLVHAPAFGVRLLGTLLVTWTVALALAPTAPFFPSRAVQMAWVVWDVVLAAAMMSLATRWRSGLARALAVGTSIDAALTLVQALAYDAPRVRTMREVLALIVACAGPILATSLLWGAIHAPRTTTRQAPS
ncbi:MAG: DUF2156 domain-containing protein [Polyangiaceae bacterium]